MTNYASISNEDNWNLARWQPVAASNDGSMGNLSFHEKPSRDKKDFSSSRRVGKIWNARKSNCKLLHNAIARGVTRGSRHLA